MTEEVNNKISYTLKFNRDTGQSELIEVNYTPIPSDPEFNNFIAHDIANNSITGIALTLDQVTGTSNRGFVYTGTVPNLTFPYMFLKKSVFTNITVNFVRNLLYFCKYF